MRCAAACQFLYFWNSRQRLIKIGELGKDWGQPGARYTKMNYIELRYYTTEWCCINTAGCFGLQFDPCSLIPRNRLFSAMAFCSRFVYWTILSIYMSTMIHNVFCFSTALLVATSTKSKWSTKRQLPSVCSVQSFFLLQKLTREIQQDMVRLVAVFDDMWFNSIRDTPNVPPCIGLHMFTHLILCFKFRPVGGWEDP